MNGYIAGSIPAHAAIPGTTWNKQKGNLMDRFNELASSLTDFQAWIFGSVDGTVDEADWNLRDDPAYRAGFKRGRDLAAVKAARQS